MSIEYPNLEATLRGLRFISDDVGSNVEGAAFHLSEIAEIAADVVLSARVVASEDANEDIRLEHFANIGIQVEHLMSHWKELVVITPWVAVDEP